MGVHDGHRKRMLDKFHKNGFEPFEEHERLEMLLYFSVPRRDTNEMAHLLLNKFHTISGVINASEKELAEFPFITSRTIQFFKIIKEVNVLCKQQEKGKITYLSTLDEFVSYFQLFFATVTDERLAVLSLNNKGKFLGCEFVSHGDIASVGVSTRKIVETVLKTKATEVVICHNHPGGIALPSQADIVVTRNIKTALDSVNVTLKDHIIITHGDYVSLAEAEEFCNIFNQQ